jgi:hypothetical protein
MKWATDITNSTQKIGVSHPDFLVIRRLVEYSIPHILGWNALEGRRSIEDDIDSSTGGDHDF